MRKKKIVEVDYRTRGRSHWFGHAPVTEKGSIYGWNRLCKFWQDWKNTPFFLYYNREQMHWKKDEEER